MNYLVTYQYEIKCLCHKTYDPYFGMEYLNMEYFGIWNILKYGLFLNMVNLDDDKIKRNILL